MTHFHVPPASSPEEEIPLPIKWEPWWAQNQFLVLKKMKSNIRVGNKNHHISAHQL
jgi:hypothetical protein